MPKMFITRINLGRKVTNTEDQIRVVEAILELFSPDAKVKWTSDSALQFSMTSKDSGSVARVQQSWENAPDAWVTNFKEYCLNEGIFSGNEEGFGDCIESYYRVMNRMGKEKYAFEDYLNALHDNEGIEEVIPIFKMLLIVYK